LGWLLLYKQPALFVARSNIDASIQQRINSYIVRSIQKSSNAKATKQKGLLN
jgi:hypothetical protein